MSAEREGDPVARPTNGAAGSSRPAGLAWQSWDARLGEAGPWHGPRRDRPDGTKDVPWPLRLDGHALENLVYVAGGELPPDGATVVVCEGEKAADAAAETGAYALGTVCGAPSSPGPAVVALLARYQVTLSPDNDQGGREHMARIARDLERAGLPTLRWIDPPAEAPKGWDLADVVDVDERRALIDGARELLGFGLKPDDPADIDALLVAWPDPPPDEGDHELEPGAPEPSAWPDPPADAAYHGVLGEIALAVAPHTEADPVGLLGTLLAMFGAACGDGRALYQGSLQRTNLSILLVGETGFRGRKGTALDVARSVFRLAYPDLDGLWLVGVASGEAITGHLGRHETEERVLIVEPEFGRLLTIMNRDGSTLSAVLRNAWDGVPLGHARARDESLVARHHVTLLGHITPIELRAKLTDADAANGFANRILFLAVRRSRLIPFPEAPDALVRQYVEPLHRAIVEARAAGDMAFDQAARDRWEAFYAELALSPRLGLAGAVTGRHEAQVARFALVYALADRSSVVGEGHLDAAIALADYARRSATWALGDSTGNRHADVLRRMLGDGQIDWKDARAALGLRTAADVAEAVGVLVDAGLAEIVTIPRDGGGRPRRAIAAKGAKGAKGAGAARTEESRITTRPHHLLHSLESSTLDRTSSVRRAHSSTKVAVEGAAF